MLLAHTLQVLEINKRVQRQNNSPNGFPNFVRQGFDLKVVADGYTKHPDGFIYRVSSLWDGPESMAEIVPAHQALSCRRVAGTQPEPDIAAHCQRMYGPYKTSQLLRCSKCSAISLAAAGLSGGSRGAASGWAGGDFQLCGLQRVRRQD